MENQYGKDVPTKHLYSHTHIYLSQFSLIYSISLFFFKFLLRIYSVPSDWAMESKRFTVLIKELTTLMKAGVSQQLECSKTTNSRWMLRYHTGFHLYYIVEQGKLIWSGLTESIREQEMLELINLE